LFNNPVGYFTSRAKCSAFLLFLSGSCSKTEVFKQLYCFIEPEVRTNRVSKQAHRSAFFSKCENSIVKVAAASVPIKKRSAFLGIYPQRPSMAAGPGHKIFLTVPPFSRSVKTPS
jgi:hypothetical protein